MSAKSEAIKQSREGKALTRKWVERGVITHIPAIYNPLVTIGHHTPEFWLYVDGQNRTIVFSHERPSGVLKILIDGGAIRVRVGESRVAKVVAAIRECHNNGEKCTVSLYGEVTATEAQ